MLSILAGSVAVQDLIRRLWSSTFAWKSCQLPDEESCQAMHLAVFYALPLYSLSIWSLVGFVYLPRQSWPYLFRLKRLRWKTLIMLTCAPLGTTNLLAASKRSLHHRSLPTRDQPITSWERNDTPGRNLSESSRSACHSMPAQFNSISILFYSARSGVFFKTNKQTQNSRIIDILAARESGSGEDGDSQSQPLFLYIYSFTKCIVFSFLFYLLKLFHRCFYYSWF